MKIGLIGYGNMGSAIADRVKKKYPVVIFDKDASKVSGAGGIEVVAGLVDLANRCDIIILAVKPQDFDDVLRGLSGRVRDKLVISIAAGVGISDIEKMLPGARVVRAMPNLGVKIGEAESCLCGGRSALKDDLSTAKSLFSYFGKVWIIEESFINAATAICGSGPAYIFRDMEQNRIRADRISKEKEQEYIHKLETAAQDREIGFDPNLASQFAIATTSTSLHLVQQTGLSPEALRKLVTSPGGTTEAALKILSHDGENWTAAAIAAKKRAEELSKKR